MPERARADFHRMLETATPASLRRTSDGTRWTNKLLLFHMLFGYLIVRTLIPLVRFLARLPGPVSSGFARLLERGQHALPHRELPGFLQRVAAAPSPRTMPCPPWWAAHRTSPGCPPSARTMRCPPWWAAHSARDTRAQPLGPTAGARAGRYRSVDPVDDQREEVRSGTGAPSSAREAGRQAAACSFNEAYAAVSKSR